VRRTCRRWPHPRGCRAGPTKSAAAGSKIDRDCATNVPAFLLPAIPRTNAEACTWPSPAEFMQVVALSAHAATDGQKRAADSRTPGEGNRGSRLCSHGGVENAFMARIRRRAPADPYSRHGPARLGMGHEESLAESDLLDQWKDQVGAKTYHDLCRSQEVYNMVTVARCMITAALHRTESLRQCLLPSRLSGDG